MTTKLTPLETRVLGVLLEKEVTTPEQYPLSLNALTLASNQKSNRNPVMNLSETEVQGALDLLKAKHWVMPVTGQRTQKFKQRFCNTEFSDFQFSDQARAIICLLLLRGPQTAGELRTRSQRMTDFNDVAEVEKTLDELASQASGELVERLAREPGKREVRYRQCLSETSEGDSRESDAGVSEVLSSGSYPVNPVNVAESSDDVAALMHRIETLEQRIAKLESQIASQDLPKQSGDQLGKNQ